MCRSAFWAVRRWLGLRAFVRAVFSASGRFRMCVLRLVAGRCCGDFSWATSKWGHHAALFEFAHQFRCFFLVDAKIVHQHGHSDGIASGYVFHGVVVEGGLFVVNDVLFREWGRQFAVGLVHRFKRLFCCGHIQEIAIGLQHRLTFGADHRIAHRCEGLFLY